jgi:hypothetical protein
MQSRSHIEGLFWRNSSRHAYALAQTFAAAHSGVELVLLDFFVLLDRPE